MPETVKKASGRENEHNRIIALHHPPGVLTLIAMCAQSDDIIEADIATGELLSRAATGSRIANGMFLSAGDDRDVYYCSTLTWARVHWS